MKINFNQLVVDVRGRAYREARIGDDGKPAIGADGRAELETKTWAHFVTEALVSMAQGERAGQKEKIERYELARRIVAAEGDVELTTSEAALILARLDQSYGPLIVGQIAPALEAGKKKPK